jgi:hypothetical protein
MLKSFPIIFTVIGCPKKSDLDHYYLKTGELSAKNCQNQHTFLHQPNTFFVMNFAVKLSAELRSVPVLSRYCKLSDKNVQNLIFWDTLWKIGCIQLQHTFLDHPNTFFFYDLCSKTLSRGYKLPKKVTLKGKNMHPHHIPSYVA